MTKIVPIKGYHETPESLIAELSEKKLDDVKGMICILFEGEAQDMTTTLVSATEGQVALAAARLLTLASGLPVMIEGPEEAS
jgi:hypothetical protein